jgi:hypothetical protein
MRAKQHICKRYDFKTLFMPRENCLRIRFAVRGATAKLSGEVTESSPWARKHVSCGRHLTSLRLRI